MGQYFICCAALFGRSLWCRAVSDMAARPVMMGWRKCWRLFCASRAGVTIMAGRALGFSREAAARYSMLMAMPVILAFALFSLLDLWAAGNVAALGTAHEGGAAALFAFASIDIFFEIDALPIAFALVLIASGWARRFCWHGSPARFLPCGRKRAK